jgi:conjugal transfer/entry exclusion protein
MFWRTRPAASFTTSRVQQLMKLRQLMITDMESKQAYQATMIQQQANSEAAAEQFFQFGGAIGDGRTFLQGWH